jgi:hypothetical protein
MYALFRFGSAKASQSTTVRSKQPTRIARSPWESQSAATYICCVRAASFRSTHSFLWAMIRLNTTNAKERTVLRRVVGTRSLPDDW